MEKKIGPIEFDDVATLDEHHSTKESKSAFSEGLEGLLEELKSDIEEWKIEGYAAEEPTAIIALDGGIRVMRVIVRKIEAIIKEAD